MMGPGFGDALAGLFFVRFLLVVGILLGAGFGAGYGCRACNYRPHIEMRRVTPEVSR